jgi:uncharacterized protein YacL (UPF0231 family)
VATATKEHFASFVNVDKDHKTVEVSRHAKELCVTLIAQMLFEKDVRLNAGAFVDASDLVEEVNSHYDEESWSSCPPQLRADFVASRAIMAKTAITLQQSCGWDTSSKFHF